MRCQFHLRSLLLTPLILVPLFLSATVARWSSDEELDPVSLSLRLFGYAAVYSALLSGISAYRVANRRVDGKPSVVAAGVRAGAVYGVVFGMLSCGPAYILFVWKAIAAHGLGHLGGEALALLVIPLPSLFVCAIVGAASGGIVALALDSVLGRLRGWPRC